MQVWDMNSGTQKTASEPPATECPMKCAPFNLQGGFIVLLQKISFRSVLREENIHDKDGSSGGAHFTAATEPPG